MTPYLATEIGLYLPLSFNLCCRNKQFYGSTAGRGGTAKQAQHDDVIEFEIKTLKLR